jgi:hypothetical protein
MHETRRLLAQLILLVMLLLCSASMCIYWSRVPDALHDAHVRTGLPQAKPLTDLYPRWYGTRELLLHHRDPYGAEVSREIQVAYYGRALDTSRPEDRLDQERFAYPLYVVFLMLPTVTMGFETVRTVAWWFLAVVTAAGVWCWLRFMRIQLSVIGGVAVYSFALTSVPVLQGLSLLQLGLLGASLIAAAAACAGSGRLFLAGSLLAVATIKPQMCILALAWFALWVLGDWQRRKSFLMGFGATLAVLVVASGFFLPSWLIHYPAALVAYSQYTDPKAFLAGVMPSAGYWATSMVAVSGVGWFCWRQRRESADSVWFAIAMAFVLALTVSVVPTVNASFNEVLLLPVVLLGIRHRREIVGRNRLSRMAALGLCACAILPWVLALAVLLARPDPPNGWYLAMWSAPIFSSFGLPILAFGFLILLVRALATNSTGTSKGAPLPAAELPQ